MTADSTVDEIEVAGGSAFGIEVGVTDHEAVSAMVTPSAIETGRTTGEVASPWRRIGPTNAMQR